MRNILSRLKKNLFFHCSKTSRITGVDFKNTKSLILFPFLGLAALIWLLLRVIPKPERMTYPCMKVAAPLASTFILQLVGFAGSILAFRQARKFFLNSRIFIAGLFVFFAIFAGLFSFIHTSKNANADVYDFVDPLGPNKPIGDAKGIFPGRVVWVHDPDATNENCEPMARNDGYFLDKNCDQGVVNQMLATGILKLTGKDTESEAWDAIFKYFNRNHEKGEVGYIENEKIFIKINSVHASSMDSDYSIKYNSSYGCVDTSPHAVHALLTQLVNQAGVPQENIYLGDPFRDIYKHCFDKWHAEFPDVHYMSNNSQTGREKFAKSSKKLMYYSDRASVMKYDSEAYFKILGDADYIFNIPAMKGHRWGGVTFFAKNHFGSNTRETAEHLHAGLHRTDYDAPLRAGYRKYRVMVDNMANQHLGGKTVLFFMDGLWATSYEHDPPVKFQTAPFNNDWCSSIFVSLDPVAIASVCLDVLQAEFTEEDLNASPPRYTYVRFDGVDDYLHQAADSTWWPDGIKYDPENDGTSISSLGVHEHWNNPVERLYSRNMGIGEGIELVEIKNETAIAVHTSKIFPEAGFELRQNYPNPFNPSTKIAFQLARQAKIKLEIFNLLGKKVDVLTDQFVPAGNYEFIWNGQNTNGEIVSSGVYFYRMSVNDGSLITQNTKKMAFVK